MISIVTPCYNEEENLRELVSRIRGVMATTDPDYEHIIIDNASTDNSRAVLEAEAALDPHIKLIFNIRNFGHIRSPFHGLLQAHGSCVILLASDLQDPPELIPSLVERWRDGAKVVLLVKEGTEESGMRSWGRRAYYRALNKASDSQLVADATGSGLYDRQVVEYLRKLDDPYPYLRGLVAEAGFPLETVPFFQPLRGRGRTKNNFSTLYDMAMLGFTTHSRTPLRAVTLMGFVLGVVAFIIGCVYLVRKLLDWDSYDLGLAPLTVGVFFLGATQLIALGILGEYIGNIFLRLRKLPLVIEERRTNFD